MAMNLDQDKRVAVFGNIGVPQSVRGVPKAPRSVARTPCTSTSSSTLAATTSTSQSHSASKRVSWNENLSSILTFLPPEGRSTTQTRLVDITKNNSNGKSNAVATESPSGVAALLRRLMAQNQKQRANSSSAEDVARKKEKLDRLKSKIRGLARKELQYQTKSNELRVSKQDPRLELEYHNTAIELNALRRILTEQYQRENARMSE